MGQTENFNEALKLLGLEPTETNRQQLAVFNSAIQLFQERNEKYGDLWKEYGWRGNLLHVQSKAARVRRLWWDQGGAYYDSGAHNPDIDDALDLLNYTVFFIRNVLTNNELGER